MNEIPLVSDPAAAFQAAMAAAGLLIPGPVVADGTLHREHVEGDRRGSRNAWYVLHTNPPAGAFGDWKRGTRGVWSATESKRLNPADQDMIRRRIELARAERQREQQCHHVEAQERARALWRRATLARPDHPYLVRKRVSAALARQHGPRLVLPVADLEDRLWSLQFIDPEGGKMLLSGGRKRGHCIPVAGAMPNASRILVCEGWATGRTLAQMEPAALVLAAIDAGNLEPVALAVRQRWRNAEIVICCDADEVGVTKGRAAAIAAGADVAIPEFPEGTPGSDFNDLANALQAVAP